MIERLLEGGLPVQEGQSVAEGHERHYVQTSALTGPQIIYNIVKNAQFLL